MTVRFVVTQSWRFDATECVDLYFGDGSFGSGCASVSTVGSGVGADGLAYNTVQYVETHTYAAQGSYEARYDSCCRVSTLTIGADGSFWVSAQVSIGAGNTAGPAAILSPINTLSLGGVGSIVVPMSDPDGDTVTCRFASDAETGIAPAIPSAGGRQPTISSVGNICTVSWDVRAPAVSGENYVLPLVFESTRNGQVSSLQMDTMVVLSNAVPPTCVGGGTFTLVPGALFSHTLTGSKAGSILTMSAGGFPSGSSFTPAVGASANSPFSTTFSWTPPVSAASSTTAFTVQYTDPLNLQASCSMVLTVPGVAATPTPVPTLSELTKFLLSMLVVVSGLIALRRYTKSD